MRGEEAKMRKGRRGCEARGSMNNPLANHDRIKTRWEPKISQAKEAWCNNAATEHNTTAATPAASLTSSGSKNAGGIIESYYNMTVYSKNSNVEL